VRGTEQRYGMRGARSAAVAASAKVERTKEARWLESSGDLEVSRQKI